MATRKWLKKGAKLAKKKVIWFLLAVTSPILAKLLPALLLVSIISVVGVSVVSNVEPSEIPRCPLAKGILGDFFGFPAAVVKDLTPEEKRAVLEALGLAYVGDALAFVNETYTTKEVVLGVGSRFSSVLAALNLIDNVAESSVQSAYNKISEEVRKSSCPALAGALFSIVDVSKVLEYLLSADGIDAPGEGILQLDGTALAAAAYSIGGLSLSGTNARELADSEEVPIVEGLKGPPGFFSEIDKLQKGDLIFLYDPSSPASADRDDLNSEAIGQQVTHVAVYLGENPDGVDQRGWVAIIDQETRSVAVQLWSDSAPQWKQVVGIGRPSRAGNVTCSREWCVPIPADAYQGFGGWRTAKRPTHYGVDISAARGTSIHAAAAGEVVAVACDRGAPAIRDGYQCADPAPVTADGWGIQGYGCGWMVKIKHSANSATLYCHMTTKPDHIKPGDTVQAGEIIGFVGSSGSSSGPHLHFQVHNGWPTSGGSNDIDPVVHYAGVGIDLEDGRPA